jgi:tetratricopeptide (TPR) repeat protein
MNWGKNKRFLVLLCIGILCVFSVLSVTLWLVLRPSERLEPPEPDLAEVDPEVAQAIIEAREKVRQQPNNGAGWGRLGMVLLAHDFHDEAQRSFAQAERLDPADGRWPYLRGLSLLLSDPDAGISCLRRAAERCGDDPLAPRLRLAETLLNLGRLDEAERQLEQARKVEPHNPRVQLGLGRLALLRGQWDAALEHLDPCTNDVHARRLAHTLRAEVWTRLGQPDKAREEQEQAAKAPEDQLWLDPFMEDVLRLRRGLAIRLQRANDLFAQQRYPQAMELLEETVKRYPQAMAARLLLGDFCRRLGRSEQAEQTFAEAVRIDPESADAWFRLGSIQAVRSRIREATDSFRKTIAFKPDHADAHYNLGQCLKQQGDSAGATEEFRAALRCRPDHKPAQQALREMEKKSR